jgi:anaerobic magnesium-protoporphyrin IX monomethyl ester cyclase
VRRVLLLNPPADGRYIRDQFCSHRSKGAYYWQPLDLLVLSGQIAEAGFDVRVVDAVAEGMSIASAHRRIEEVAPDAVVFLTGSDTFPNDVAFVEETKRRGVAVAVGIGDILRDQGERLLERHPAIDACLNDFVTHGLVPFLSGRIDLAANMTVRTSEGVRTVPAPPPARTFTLPTPRYDLFPLHRYRMPFNRRHPYAAVVASSWCPYRCAFCPFAGTPFRTREVNDCIANLEAVRRMGIRQVHFADWTFAVDRRHAENLLRRMVAAGFGFDWSCLSRVDLFDRPLLELAKAAGCHLIEFGVESGSQELLDRYEKHISIEQVRRTFRHCRELGISTLATFVLGLPGETPRTLDLTLDLALEIDPTYCSFNVASPRMGTALRRTYVGTEACPDAGTPLDSSWSTPVFSSEQLPGPTLDAFRRRAVRRFYGRPAYLWRRLRETGSFVELRNQVVDGLALAWQTVRRPKSPTGVAAPVSDAARPGMEQ